MGSREWSRIDGYSKDESGNSNCPSYIMNYIITSWKLPGERGNQQVFCNRILKNAMDMGIIEVRIKDSVLADSSLENELIERFPIKRAIIVPDLVGNPQILMQDVCAALAEDLPRT